MTALAIGDWHGDCQTVSPAPVGILGADRARYVTVGGREHRVRGAWSDPWWMIGPGGWAVSRRWRHPEQTGMAWDGGRGHPVTIPAADERVLTPVDAAGEPRDRL
jgi:hypothetical protein